MITINLKKIKELDPELYETVCFYFDFVPGDEGTHQVREAKLSMLFQADQERLKELMKDPEPEEFRIEPGEAEKRKKIADAEAALARLQEFVNKRDLLPVPENAQAIKQWLEANAGGYWSHNNVDAAISKLRNTLKWKPTPPRVSPAPQPEVVKLSDGSEQLPIDTVPSHRHSKVQLKDLDARQRAVAKKDRKGWHATTL